jgi:hypothetical protein
MYKIHEIQETLENLLRAGKEASNIVKFPSQNIEQAKGIGE